MADASALSQQEYKRARQRVAGILAGMSVGSPSLMDDRAVEPEDLALAERLLDAGVIDLGAL